jgi:hypothetical protein
VRSGIEPLEGRIAPAVLVNAHLLTYTDENGDLVSVKFSKDIFDLSSIALPSIFKFNHGQAHVGSPNGTTSRSTQLIDPGQVPLKIINVTLKNRWRRFESALPRNSKPRMRHR